MMKSRLIRVCAVVLIFAWAVFMLLAVAGGSAEEWFPIVTAALAAAFLFIGAVYWALNPKT